MSGDNKYVQERKKHVREHGPCKDLAVNPAAAEKIATYDSAISRLEAFLSKPGMASPERLEKARKELKNLEQGKAKYMEDLKKIKS